MRGGGARLAFRPFKVISACKTLIGFLLLPPASGGWRLERRLGVSVSAVLSGQLPTAGLPVGKRRRTETPPPLFSGRKR